MWTEAEEESLRDLWASGLTAGEIGRQIGKTRNSVLGKKDRLGLAERRQAHRRRKARSLASKPAPQPVALLPAAPVVRLPDPPPHERVSLNDLPSDACHWFIGDPKQTSAGYCGRPTDGLWPYCATHLHRSINHDGMKRARQRERV